MTPPSAHLAAASQEAGPLLLNPSDRGGRSEPLAPSMAGAKVVPGANPFGFYSTALHDPGAPGRVLILRIGDSTRNYYPDEAIR